MTAWKNSTCRRSSTSESHLYVLRKVHTVVKTWLGFPGGSAEVQGMFALNIIRVSGSPIALILEGVWDTYLHIKQGLLGNHFVHSRQIDASALDSFVSQLEALPIADPDSAERSTLQDVIMLYRRSLEGAASSDAVPSHPLRPVPSIRTRVQQPPSSDASVPPPHVGRPYVQVPPSL